MEVQVTSCQIEIRPVGSFLEFEEQVRHAFERVPAESDYVLLPELFTLGLLATFEDFESMPVTDYRRLAGFLDEYKALFSALSEERGQVILAGTTLEEDGGRLFNTAFIFSPDGPIQSHRKTHIFPGEAAWNTSEGDRIEVFSAGPVTFGVAVCYEMEIPEISAIYQQKGADLIFCPSFTFTPHGFWRVRHCAHARAIENQVYAVHCPTVGPSYGIIKPGFGTGAVLSPCDLAWTESGVLAEGSEEERIVTAKLSMEALYENRRTGAATTVRDRRRRKSLYENESGGVDRGGMIR